MDSNKDECKLIAVLSFGLLEVFFYCYQVNIWIKVDRIYDILWKNSYI